MGKKSKDKSSSEKSLMDKSSKTKQPKSKKSGEGKTPRKTPTGQQHRFDLRDFEVRPDTALDLTKWPTRVGQESLSKDLAEEALAADVAALQAAQERLYASNRYGLLVILQGMDASGKDGVVQHVMRGVNPLGCRAYAFKAPDETELKHHFLWRPMAYLPERGMISIFNRSYYEEVLVVRVHPSFLQPQRLPQVRLDKPKSLEKLWKERFREINAMERSLVNNGTLVLKFFLHLSAQEQKSRLLQRIEQPHKNWKFNPGDLAERKLWPQYRHAIEEAVGQTSTEWAPWYVIPADNKWYARAAIADIIAARLEELDLSYPEVSDQQRELFARMAAELANE